jgi:hypothetical protein
MAHRGLLRQNSYSSTIMNEMNSHTNGFPEFFRDLKFTLAAFAAGSRVVPMADNRRVIADLTARAASIYGKDASRVNEKPA